MLLYITVVHSCVLLLNIPLCEYSTINFYFKDTVLFQVFCNINNNAIDTVAHIFWCICARISVGHCLEIKCVVYRIMQVVYRIMCSVQDYECTNVHNTWYSFIGDTINFLSEKRKFSFIPSLLTVLHEQLLNCIKCFFYSERVSYCQNNAAKQNSVT